MSQLQKGIENETSIRRSRSPFAHPDEISLIVATSIKRPSSA